MSKPEIPLINVIGYLNGSAGIAVNARNFIDVFREANIPFVTTSLSSTTDKENHNYISAPNHAYPTNLRRDCSKDFRKTPKIQGEEFKTPVINLFCIPTGEIPNVAMNWGWKNLKKSYNISVWFWETDVIPDRLQIPFDYLDELWVSSPYMQEVLAKHTSLKISYIPSPIIPGAAFKADALASSSDLSLPESTFLFYFIYDFYSNFDRKNPLAIISSFLKAFPKNENVSLMIKTMNGDKFPSQMALMQDAICGDSRIKLINRYITKDEKDALMHRCNCYVSLHRSEGLGLTMGEAMILGKPVIATGYSGNLDFMNESNSFLCSYEMAKVGKDNLYFFPENGSWAEPNREDAIRLMRYVYENQEEAAQIGAKAKQHILENYNLQSIGSAVKDRFLHSTLKKNALKKPKHLSKLQMKETIKTLMKLYK